MFVVKYSELGVKSRAVRARMEKLLMENIRNAYKKNKIDVKVRKKDGRIAVDGENGEILEKIFGVSSYCKAIVCEKDIEKIANEVSESMEKNKKYKIEVNRTDKNFPLTAPEITKIMVERIENRGLKLGVKSYDEKIVIEIREGGAYVLFDERKGPGGMPYGTGGNALALFSGGIDSPVAAWMVAKRGVRVDFLFYSFNESIKENVVGVFRKLNDDWFLGGKLFIFDGREINKQIAECEERYRQVIFKRVLYRIANSIPGYDGIVTGESIGQVSSQTLKNLSVIDKASERIVLRPLVGLDKQEITDMAKKIGTYELSAHIPEFCAFTKKKPATAAKLSDVEEEEKKIDWNVVDEKVRNVEVIC
ncbi:MAG: tRNA uracil 4-sulfurtransferase ThiI [Candidatus Anstonellales archaeon]